MVTRISGLASGMDIDSMVKQMLSVDRIKVDKVSQNKQKLEWKQQAYNGLNKELANFLIEARKDFGLMKTTSTGTNINTGLSSIGWHKTATSSDDTKVTATISGTNSFAGAHTVNVKSLAEGVTATSTVATGLKDAKLAVYEGTFKINGKDISVTAEDTLSTLAKKINSSGAGVKASYDSTLDRFFLQTDGVGASAKIEITDSAVAVDSLLEKLSLGIKKPDDTIEILVKDVVHNGVDGQVEYNGIATSVKSNNFTFNGVNFTAKDETEVGKPVTITVGTDTQAAMDKIKGFVEEYNKIVEKMGNVIGERSNRNYQPLTSDEKEAMTEKEIELWEERAKKGLLYRDDTINKTLSNLRGSLYDKLADASGTFSHISEIGITTEKYTSGSVGGKLAIDEDKLRAALNSDADSVLEVLFKEGAAPTGSTSGVVREDARGVFTRISDNLIDGMKDIIDRSGTGDSAELFRNIKSNMLIDFITGNNMSKQGSISMIDKDMLNMNKQLDDLNTWLFNRENTYYSRFTAMEKAMQNANNQSSWLYQQMGS